MPPLPFLSRPSPAPLQSLFRLVALATTILLPLLSGPAHAKILEFDVCVYGDTSGAVTAAVQAARMGKDVVLVSPNAHLGGLTSSGLGWTDLGNINILGGLSREFYHRVYLHYQNDSAWVQQTRASYGNTGQGGQAFNDATQTGSVFEPKVAERIFNELIQEHGIPVIRGRLLLDGGVIKDGQRIAAMRLENGDEVRAQMFIDATYEGDLMAKAGVSYTVGRESNLQYGETLNGIQTARSGSNQLRNGIDPYVIKGVPSSGLLPGVSPDPGGPDGSADTKLQAYCYRMVLTDAPGNRVMIGQPEGYNEADYEILFRSIEAGQTSGFFKLDRMPNLKTDSNNTGGISTDFIGKNYNYPEADYATRAQIELAHQRWQRGLVWTLQNHPRVPKSIRDGLAKWGLPLDEFTDNGHWPYQLYVREARRMVSDYVMTEKNCNGTIIAPDSIGMGAYTMDSHHTQRYVKDGQVKNEGDVQVGVPRPYPISYRSIVPKAGECTNLLVPWCLSASHIAYGSIRMEPVFMALGQSAATAACFAIDDDLSVQEVPYAKLKAQMLADGQALTTGISDATGIVVDNLDTTGVTITGAWDESGATPGFFGPNYLHNQGDGNGSKSVRFTPDLPAAGEYDVYLRWTSHSNRSKTVPVDVISAEGTSTIVVDQQKNGSTWFLLKRAQFSSGKNGSVVVRTTGTTSGTYVIADAARWVPVGQVGTVPVQIIATDPVTREGTNDVARLTLQRPSTATATDLVVNYSISGTAQGNDYRPLPGTVTIPAGSSTATIVVEALADTRAEGTETVIITLQPRNDYLLTELNTATVRILDRPIDQWRHNHFSSAELANPATSGDTADPDNDGLTNLSEYSLGLSPKSSDAGALALQMVDGRLTLTYPRRKKSTDISLIAEGSRDLSEWSSNAVEVISKRDDGNIEHIIVRLALPQEQVEHGFLRLKTTR